MSSVVLHSRPLGNVEEPVQRIIRKYTSIHKAVKFRFFFVHSQGCQFRFFLCSLECHQPNLTFDVVMTAATYSHHYPMQTVDLCSSPAAMPDIPTRSMPLQLPRV